MSDLIKVNLETIGDIWPLIATLPYDTLIDAAVHGYHGEILVNSIENPTICQLKVDDFYYFAGDATHPSAERLVSNLPKWATIVTAHNGWDTLIDKIHNGHVQRSTRYSLTHKFIDATTLQPFIDALPKQYEIRKINHELALKIKSERWLNSFIGNFNDIDDFLNRGLGFCVLEGDQILSGASSYIYFNGGYEVEINTHIDYRKRGLATAVGARFIQHCLEQGMIPHWDAENAYSIKIAQRFGFRIDREYDTIIVNYN